MKRKTIIILAAVFIILLGIAVYPEVKTRFFPNTNQDSKPNYFSFDVDSLDKITIKSSADEVVLEKKNGFWEVNNLPVDQERISTFFEALKSLRAGPMVSKNKDNFPSYEVDEKQRILLTVSSGGQDYKLIIGKPGSSASTFYGKGENEEAVYLFEGSLRVFLDTTQKYWLEKTIVSLEKEAVAKVEVGPPYQILLKKINEKWQAEVKSKNTDLTDEEALKILAVFSPLEAYDMAVGEEKEFFDNLKNKITIEVFDKAEVNLASLFAAAKDDEYLLKAKNSDFLYKVYKYKFDDLLSLKDKVK